MKKFTFLVCIALLLSANLTFSQYSAGGTPMSELINLRSGFDIKTAPGFDVERYKAEDYENASKMDVPYRYGAALDVNYNLNNSGTWTVLPDGSRIWRLAIYSQDAYSISLFYNNFKLPYGGLFYIYNLNKSMVLGAFSEINNSENNEFATQPTTGDATVLEYYEPVFAKGKGRIEISKVIHAYRDIFGLLNAEELACNININCPVGAPWVNEKRSVTRITFTQGAGQFLCTGSLVNNVLQNRALYYLTAEHCAPDNHSSMVFYFNYENPTCVGTGGPLNQTLSGATLKAANFATDFRLVTINGSLPASFNAYFNGWDRSGAQPQNEVAIHHPGGANKKYSKDNNPSASVTGFGGRLVNGFWQCVWDIGMTEGGSSGCPLYDQNKRVIGQNLGGATSQCTNPQIVTKVFGKFSESWGYGGSSTNQLKDWLDPNNTGVNTLDGINDLTGVAPVSNFTSDTLAFPIGGGSVNFFDLSTNTPTTWSWSFPGGTPSSSTSQNPANISYTATGGYTVTLTTTNTFGTNVKTLVNYITVAGVPMNVFSLISPPTFSQVIVNGSDPTNAYFTWQRSSTSPTVKYIFKIRKLSTTIDYSYIANNNGLDSVIGLRKSFLDSLGLTMGYSGDSVRCSWRVASTNGLDTTYPSSQFIVTFKRSTIGINQISTLIPDKFSLYNNYPNPFNPTTMIEFDVAKMQNVKMKIYDIQGREVAELVNQNLTPGRYSVNFNGDRFASGIYFYTLESDNVYQVKRMALVK